jgi:aldehyde dehydrogenase (NAD+)
MLIGGGLRGSSDGTTINLINPYDGTVSNVIPAATASDANDAVLAARGAFSAGTWSDISAAARGRALLRLAELVERDAAGLGALDTADNGKILRETTKQAQLSASTYRYYAGWADKNHGAVIPLESTDLLDYMTYEPYGVCVLLVAWNSPLQLLANKLAPALAAGNTVVIKPSENASSSVLAMAPLFAEAGFPDGVVNIITGSGGVSGDALVRHPDVDLISLTGGGATGRKILQACSGRVVKVLLELGGKSPQIIFPDAPWEEAVNGVLAGIFAAAGQTCIAGSRVFVHESIFDAFVQDLQTRASAIRLGDPMSSETDMGPLANRAHFDRVVSILERAMAAGASTAGGAGGPAPEIGALFVRPTILLNTDLSDEVVCEEVFGPVVVVHPFVTEEEVVKLSNDSSFGLAAGVWTSDLRRGLRMAKALEVGNVWVNTYRHLAPAAPFGGVKQSGNGRERGLEGLREYVRSKNVMISTKPRNDDPFTVRT